MVKRKLIIIAVAAFVCLLTAGCTIVAIEMYSESFGRVEEFSEDEFTTYITWKEIDQIKYSREEVHFNSGGNRLNGFIYGRTNNNGLVVISQGLGGTADDYFPMVMYFVDKGWRVFAFNNTGVSGSEGKNVRGMTQSLIDLDTALTYVESTSAFSGLPVMLVGHSWGGYAVCAVLNYRHNVNAVVSFAGYDNGSELVKEMAVSEVGGIYYLLSPQLWALEKQLFGDAAKLTAVDGINKAVIPVMIVQSSNDEVITPDKTSIYAHRGKITNPRAEIVYLDGEDAAGHEYVFCSKEQRAYKSLVDASWAAYKAEHTDPSKTQFAQGFGFNKTLHNQLNADLMELINGFFSNSK